MIKSIDELRKQAINTFDIEEYLKVLIEEAEEKIKKTIYDGRDKVFIEILNNQFIIPYYTNCAGKVMAYYFCQVLEKKNYVFKVKTVKNGYVVIIDISKHTGPKVEDLFEKYLNSKN